MKSSLILFHLVMLSLITGSGRLPNQPYIAPVAKQNDLPVFAVFAGNTPCDGFVRQLLNVPENTDCDRIKWKLTLYKNTNTSKYQLDCIYGMQANSSPGFNGGGQTIQIKGTWLTRKGTKASPDATVYQLNLANKTSISLVRMDDHVLHFLYKDNNLLIGSASWGYALNRINN